MIAAEKLPATEHRRFDGSGKEALEMGRNRLLVTAAVLSLAFFGIAIRLFDLAVLTGAEPAVAAVPATPPPLVSRSDIVDRNGVVLASSLPTASLYADPAEVIDPKGAVEKIITVFPEIDQARLLRQLSGKGRFVWVRRNLSPQQQMAANRLGIPGFSFLREERRVYPHGELTAHVLGITDVDSNGIAGIERQFDERLRRENAPLELSIDVRVQSILRTELMAAMTEFKAIGAAGVVLDVHTGETLAMVSLPDFDANDRRSYRGEVKFNRATKGVYEMGSTFKLFTAAMALDSGTVNLSGGYDATQPIRISRFTISDYKPKKRWLSVPEIIVYSSNIGTAKMAIDVGGAGQQEYLGRLGLLSRSGLELPEVARPLTPSVWRDISTMTVSYGHGISVTPVQLTNAIATVVNGGVFREATLLRQSIEAPRQGEQVLSPGTSEKLRQLMRLVVAEGTGRKAKAEGYYVGGKTGTADKPVDGAYQQGYKKNKKISSFVGAFPIHAPRYAVFAMLDEPVGNKRTFNYATGGWVAAPIVGRVVQQIGPLLGIEPVLTGDEPMDLPWDDETKPTQTPVQAVQAAVKRTVSTAPKPLASPLAKPVASKPATATSTALPPAPKPVKAGVPESLPAPQATRDETPDERIARKTREALEQAFVEQ